MVKNEVFSSMVAYAYESRKTKSESQSHCSIIIKLLSACEINFPVCYKTKHYNNHYVTISKNELAELLEF